MSFHAVTPAGDPQEVSENPKVSGSWEYLGPRILHLATKGKARQVLAGLAQPGRGGKVMRCLPTALGSLGTCAI